MENKKILTQGFGASQGLVAIYIENPPKMREYQQLEKVIQLQPSEVDYINQQCGNGWRKIFNVFAKFLAELNHPDHHFTNEMTWQYYRDTKLLQTSSQEALLFSTPDLLSQNYRWHIISGKTYAKRLLRDHIFTKSLIWLDDDFAIDRVNNLIICPFLDYRQLNNEKIKRLAHLIKSHPDHIFTN